SLFAPWRNVTASPSRIEKMTTTVSSSRMVTPFPPRGGPKGGIPLPGIRAAEFGIRRSLIAAAAKVVGRPGLSVPPAAAELEAAGAVERLGGGILLGADRDRLGLVGEHRLGQRRPGLREVLAVHVPDRVAE